MRGEKFQKYIMTPYNLAEKSTVIDIHDLLQLPCQAIECSLVHVSPQGGLYLLQMSWF